MQKFTFNRQLTGLFTEQQNLLAYEQDQLLQFLGHAFTKGNFEKQIAAKAKNYSAELRSNLVQELENIYNINASSEIKANLDLLKKEGTYTITTGHQLNIFTGPIYFIYKIIHVIRLTEELKKEYPDYNFVPVFWMASEDHDLDEIRSVNVFGKELKWQTDQQGPVGRMDCSDLAYLKDELNSFYSNHPESEVTDLINKYSGKNLAEATFNLVNRLFASYGLLILDGDNPFFKKSFLSFMEKELKEEFSQTEVLKTNERIVKEGFKTQVNPREINLFYLSDQSRKRILKNEQGFFIEGLGNLSSEKLFQLLQEHPESFSPNVILRPLYQEVILPNLCYVGGVGELTYWMQLKGVFENAGITFPMIQARTSMLWVDGVTSKKMEKNGLLLEDLFEDAEKLKKRFLGEIASEEINFDELNKNLEQIKSALYDKINQVDAGLQKFAEAELVKLDKQIESVKEKLTRSVKQRHESVIHSIDQISEKLFPGGDLQERSLNLFTMCPDGKVFDKIAQLYKITDPFNPDFVIIQE
jgi:bacillithiol biosynthesis cysteine-adding enzyme BshC